MNQPPACFRFGATSQVLAFDCADGPPSAVTSIEVWDDAQPYTSTAESATTGSAAVETATTTLTAAAGPAAARSDRLTLTAVTNFSVGRRYWLTSSEGWRELVEVIGKDTSNKYLYLRTGLQRAYASGDTIATPRVQISFLDSWLADTNKLSGARFSSQYGWLNEWQRDWLAQLDPNPRWRVAIVLTVGGAVSRYTMFFDVVRDPLEHGVTAQDIDRLSRGFLARLTAEDVGEADALIEEAMHQVKLDLHAYDVAAYAVSGRDILAEAVRRKAVALVHQQAYFHGGGNGDPTLMDSSDKFYRDHLDKLIGAKSRAMAQATVDGAAALLPNAPLFVR